MNFLAPLISRRAGHRHVPRCGSVDRHTRPCVPAMPPAAPPPPFPRLEDGPIGQASPARIDGASLGLRQVQPSRLLFRRDELRRHADGRVAGWHWLVDKSRCGNGRTIADLDVAKHRRLGAEEDATPYLWVAVELRPRAGGSQGHWRRWWWWWRWWWREGRLRWQWVAVAAAAAAVVLVGGIGGGGLCLIPN